MSVQGLWSRSGRSHSSGRDLEVAEMDEYSKRGVEGEVRGAW